MNFKKILLLLCIISIANTITPMHNSDPLYNQCKKLLENRHNNNENLNAPLPDKRYPLLCKLIKNGYNNLVKFVLKNQLGIDLDQQFGIFKFTFLHKAARAANHEAIKMLLERKAEIDSVSVKNDTPLCYASSEGDLECIKLLVSSGANVNHQGYDRTTPLGACVRYAETAIAPVKYLLSQNANPNIPDEFDEIPLISAVDDFSERTLTDIKNITQLLITYGADTTLRTNSCGHRYFGTNTATAAKLARAKNWNTIADFIEKYAQQRDELINKVKNNESIDYLHIPLAMSYLKDTQGNNLAWHAIQNNNWAVLNKLIHLRPEIITKPNFAGEKPVDLISEKDNFKIWFINHLNYEQLAQPMIEESQLLN